MRTIIFSLSAALSIFMLGCGSNQQANNYKDVDAIRSEAGEDAFIADSTVVTSSAAKVSMQDSTRKFIRTAELKFQVEDVVKATYRIENIVQELGGFVTYTNLESTVDNTDTYKLNADSSIKITTYTVANNMTVRVPTEDLDSALRAIATGFEFMNYRIIKADDVALQILQNNLTQKRVGNSEKRLTNAIDERGKKLKETASAEELLLNKQAEKDRAKLANLSLLDKINYSTVKLEIYQNEVTKKKLIANINYGEKYKQSFGSRLVDSLKTGWVIVEEIFFVLVKLWSVILIGLLIYFIIKRSRKKKKEIKS